MQKYVISATRGRSIGTKQKLWVARELFIKLLEPSLPMQICLTWAKQKCSQSLNIVETFGMNWRILVKKI